MASVVEVCNSALQKLGADRISSLSDSNKNARAVNSAYARLRDKLLRQKAWGFAIKRAELAASSTDPAFGPAKQYPVPSDFLRLLAPDPEANLNSLDWRVERGPSGRVIVTEDGAPLQIRYVSQVTDPNEMDSLFLELWAVEIALDICQEITGSNTKKEALREDRKTILTEARQVNAFESVADEPPLDTWITARL